MLAPIIQGISLGLVLAIMIGPVFFMLLNTSIKKGFKPAAYLAAGVALSDILFICISLYGSSRIEGLNTHDKIIGWAGGILLIIFGLITLLKKGKVATEGLELPDDSKTLLIDTAKGFAMNTLNPFVLIFWLGVTSAMHSGQINEASEKLIFFSAVIVTVLATDLLKAFLASKLKKLLTVKLLTTLNRISGTGLILFGIRLISKM